MKKVLLTLLAILTFGAIAQAETITWTVTGVETPASSGSDVNTALSATCTVDNNNEVSDGGTWTAVASNSYADKNQGAKLGSNTKPFKGPI